MFPVQQYYSEANTQAEITLPSPAAPACVRGWGLACADGMGFFICGGREVLIWGNLMISRLCLLKIKNRR